MTDGLIRRLDRMLTALPFERIEGPPDPRPCRSLVEGREDPGGHDIENVSSEAPVNGRVIAARFGFADTHEVRPDEQFGRGLPSESLQVDLDQLGVTAERLAESAFQDRRQVPAPCWPHSDGAHSNEVVI